jgi:cleavage and polyadenylation specificity factor subunit 1
VVLLYDRHLAVIPFISDSQSSDTANAAVSKPASSYLIDLQKLGILNIKDFQFVNGYYEPTLMFVFEPDRTWAGRYVKKKNTCSAAIISLHVLLKSHTIIWKLDKLPHDSHTIVPLSPPAGGALVLSFNEVHYLNQSSSQYRLSLNHFGDLAQAADGGSHTRERTRTGVCFEASRCTFLDDDTLLVSTYNGDLYALTVVTDGRTVTHIDVQKAGSASLASCVRSIWV